MSTLRLHTHAQANLSERWGCDPGSHTHGTDSSAVQRCAEPSRELMALTVTLDIKVHSTMGQDSCLSRRPLEIILYVSRYNGACFIRIKLGLPAVIYIKETWEEEQESQRRHKIGDRMNKERRHQGLERYLRGQEY